MFLLCMNAIEFAYGQDVYYTVELDPYNVIRTNNVSLKIQLCMLDDNSSKYFFNG